MLIPSCVGRVVADSRREPVRCQRSTLMPGIRKTTNAKRRFQRRTMSNEVRTWRKAWFQTERVVLVSLILILPACNIGGKTTTLALQTTPSSIAVGSQVVFTASISHNNGQFEGANWSLASNGVACPTGCGTLTNPTNTGSPGNGDTATITYTAPAVAPAPNSVTITATSVENPNSSGADTFTID